MYSIYEIVKLLKPLDFRVECEQEIETLLTDSRSLMDPKDTIFFAIKTKRGDGHKYIKHLYKVGVRSFVIEWPISHWKNELPEANLIYVKNSLNALQTLARKHRQKFQMPVIGITGSNGKTVVKEFLYQLLSEDFRIIRSPRSYNSQVGVPLSAWRMEPEYNLAIFEAGVSQPLEMSNLEQILQPTIGVFTNIGTAHQEGFRNITQKIEEKLILFRKAQYIIYNKDDALVANAIRRSGFEARSIDWSYVDPGAAIFIQDVRTSDHGTSITFRFLGLSKTVVIPFSDAASIENIIHCIAVMLLLKPTSLNKQERFDSLEPIAMRLELKEGNAGNIIINDSYNNDLAALSIALDFQQRKAKTMSMPRVLILSDILESGLLSPILYKRVAALLKKHSIDLLLAVGRSVSTERRVFDGIDAHFFATTSDLIASKMTEHISNSCILIKGARAFHFEQLTACLAKQMHETTLDISLDAILHNYNAYRSLLRQETRVICMIKAEGYGVGSYELAKALEEANADYIAVALADEGKKLRERGITMPIIVMNPEISSWDTILAYQLEPEIYSCRLLREFDRQVNMRALRSYPIHIKFDTGMHRLGFRPSDAAILGEKLNHMRRLRVSSIFSHLAAADDPSCDAATLRQFEVFDQAVEQFSEALGYRPFRHILNTVGIERFPQHQYEAVRLGIGLYGLSPSKIGGLEPVATLRSSILQINTVPAGEGIGYGYKGVLDHEARIATLPIGYADGYRRSLGNGVGQMLVNGLLCPTVGNICMDSCMIDVSEADAKEGDNVIIFGGSAPSLERLAEQTDTIPYEILSTLSPRVKRVYFRE